MTDQDIRLEARGPSLASQVHGALIEMLLSGELAPDDRISMRDLADRLADSVTIEISTVRTDPWDFVVGAQPPTDAGGMP